MNKRTGVLLACLALSGCTSLGRVYQVMMDPSLPIGGPNNEVSHVALSLYAADPPAEIRSTYKDVEQPSALPVQSALLVANLSASAPFELTGKVSALADQLLQNHPASVEDEQAINEAKIPAPLAGYAPAPSILPEGPSQPTQQVPSSIAFKVLQLRDDSLLLDATYEQVAEDLDKALGTTLISVDDYRLVPGHFKFIEPEELNERTRYIAVVAGLDDPQSKWKDAIRIKPRGYNHTVHVHFENNGVELRQDSELRRDP